MDRRGEDFQNRRHAPADDTMVFVCGLPPMYAALCGPRTEKELKEGSTLHKLGYTTAMVSKMCGGGSHSETFFLIECTHQGPA